MSAGEPRRLLVVEDDPEIQYLLSVVLGEPDREVLAVSTGREAEEALATREVDLVVLDLILPDIDGRTLVTSLRRRAETAAVPIVVISARGGSEIRQECYDLGADSYAEKPFDPDELAADVTARLERSAGRQRRPLEDSVTGLLNQAGLSDAAADTSAPYALSLLHLDGFSALAERWGWTEAQAVLRRVGEVVATGTEGAAYAGRIGGGEFGVLVTTGDLAAASDLSERLLDAIRGLTLAGPGGDPVRLTASAGVVRVEPGAPVGEALEAARRRLFQAREAGGDRVVTDGTAVETTPRLLVAEDDQISATLLLHRLRKEGLEVVRHDNGRAAYEAALEETPNLVILDVKMPGMDGFEVLERLRKLPAYHRVPIILLTSMGSEADVVRGFQLGADDYVLKPFSPVELSARVWRLLRRGRSAKAL